MKWLARLFVAEHDRRLLTDGRVNGPMPWVIAIMMFLTVLAAAAGIAIATLALGIERDLGNRITVQVTAADNAAREAEASRAERSLRAAPDVLEVTRMPDGEAAALVEPWLGPDVGSEDFPIPILIDAELTPGADFSAVAQAVKTAAPSALVDTQAGLAAPVGALMRTLSLIALGLVLLLTLATAAVVTLAARGALGNHRGVIDIVHLLGGTDRQISRLFQRRIALDALFGGLMGFVGALIVILIVQWQLSASGLGLMSGPGLPLWGWLVLALLPLTGALLASMVARLVVGRALKAML